MFSSTVSPGKIPRASGTRSRPLRARWYDGGVGDVDAVEHDGADRRRRRVPRRRSTASTSRRRWPRATRRPCRTRARVTRRGGPRRRRSRRRRPSSRSVAPVERRRRSVSRAASGIGAAAVCSYFVLGDRAVVGSSLGGGDARVAVLLALLPESLLADEREDAVGLLRELDGADPRQDRHEVDRGDERARGASAERGRSRRSSGRRPARPRARSPRAARRRGGGCRTSPRARARTARCTGGALVLLKLKL